MQPPATGVEPSACAHVMPAFQTPGFVELPLHWLARVVIKEESPDVSVHSLASPEASV